MPTTAKLVAMKPRSAQGGSPLTPELKAFIDATIVPVLVEQYLAEVSHTVGEIKLAKRQEPVSSFGGPTAATLRVRP
jgi:hypothetical protein